jgi:formylglycine-generating enzyme required for sulfatase activity
MRETSIVRRWLPRVLTLGLLSSCSLTDLDYLGADRGKPEQDGGAGGTPASAAGSESVAPGGEGPSAGSPPTPGNEGGAGHSGSGALLAGAPTGGMRDEPLHEGGQGVGGVPTEPGGITYGIVGQSCDGGLECGSGVDCCERLGVPGGSFQMGNNADANAQADEKPPHSTTLSAFELDTFEVSVGRFRQFVEAYDGTLPSVGSGAHPKLSGSGWLTDFNAEMPTSRAGLETQINCDVGGYQTWTTLAGSREQMPMNCVSWYLAFAFCVWDGERLPTEAEWELASAGGAEERTYPWGETAPSFSTHAVASCQADGSAGCAPSDLLPVGSRAQGAGRYGHLDLAGSLWEWTLDHYDATFYQSIGSCADCANIAASTPRSLRGGNFTSVAKFLRASGRASKAPRTIDPYAGFRCARSP